MESVLNQFRMKVISSTNHETEYSNGVILLQHVKPCLDTAGRHLIKLDYVKVFTGWGESWYSRYFHNFEEIRIDLCSDLTKLHDFQEKATYLNVEMECEGFENWWEVDIDFVDSFLTERVVF